MLSCGGAEGRKFQSFIRVRMRDFLPLREEFATKGSRRPLVSSLQPPSLLLAAEESCGLGIRRFCVFFLVFGVDYDRAGVGVGKSAGIAGSEIVGSGCRMAGEIFTGGCGRSDNMFGCSARRAVGTMPWKVR